MKKLATLITLMAGVGFAFGQAGTTLNFNNNGVAVGGDHKVYFDSVGNQPGVVGQNFQAELYYVDPVTSSLTPWAASISKFRVTSTASPGTWSGKTVTLPPGNGLPSSPIQVDVVAWDSTLGGTVAAGVGTWDQAKALGNVYHGESGLFTYLWANTMPAATTDTQLVTMPAFAITVPEPSAIALSVIGVAGLLFLRRRK